MSHRHSSRRRGQPHLDDEGIAYGGYQPYQPYDSYDPYEQYAPQEQYIPHGQYPSRNPYPSEPRSPPRSLPRRKRSERHRRDPSPNYYSDEPTGSSRNTKHRRSRHDDDHRGRSVGPDRRRQGLSPPPFIPEPDYGRPRKHTRPSRHERDPRRERDPRPMDPYEQEFYSREPPPRHYPADPYETASRDLPHRSRSVRQDSPPKARSRGRTSRHIDYDDNDGYVAAHRRQPRSQTRDRHNRDRSGPSPTRGRPPKTQRGRDSTARRSSMPASTKPRSPWWQNPLLQAGARGALTAGAQAAMKSRDDPSPWLGSKGAKVATAALGAAFVDGFIGQKHPKSTRQSIAKQGVDLATEKVATSAARHYR